MSRADQRPRAGPHSGSTCPIQTSKLASRRSPGSTPSTSAELPGKRGYDTAYQAVGSGVETVVDDFMTMDLAGLGTFDVVLYLEVPLPHRRSLRALRRLATVTAGVAIIETEAVEFQLAGRARLCEFLEGAVLNHDTSN